MKSRAAMMQREQSDLACSWLPANELARQLAAAMRTIAELYAKAISNPPVDADMLLALLHINQGAIRSTAEADLSLSMLDAKQAVDRLIAAGFVRISDGRTLHPTAEAAALFRQLSHVAQQQNEHWRAELQSMPIGSVVLDEFLVMLQSPSYA